MAAKLQAGRRPPWPCATYHICDVRKKVKMYFLVILFYSLALACYYSHSMQHHYDASLQMMCLQMQERNINIKLWAEAATARRSKRWLKHRAQAQRVKGILVILNVYI